MTSLDDLRAKIDRVLELVGKYDAVVNSHNVLFITQDVYNSLLPESIAVALLHLPDSALAGLPTGRVDRSECGPAGSSDLIRALEEAQACRLQNLLHGGGWLCEMDCRSASGEMTSRDDRVIKNFYMSQKKQAEVLRMSDVVAQLAEAGRLDTIADIGSGKGYLGVMLHLLYDLKVLSVDNVDSNNEGARRRLKNLNKHWMGKTEHRTGVDPNSGKAPSSSYQAVTQQFNSSVDLDDLVSRFSRTSSRSEVANPPNCQSELANQNRVFENTNSELGNHDFNDGAVLTNEWARNPVQSRTDVNQSAASRQSYNISNQNQTLANEGIDGKDDGLTASVNEKVANIPTLSCRGSQGPASLHGSERLPQAQKYLLCGLHTCGDLASSMLQAFVNSQQSRVLCLVGCCYHLLTEEFGGPSVDGCTGGDDADPDTHGSESVSGPAGFPLSRYVRAKRARIGRNARMLAAQAVDRIAEANELPDVTLFWRALFEKIVVDQMGCPDVAGLTDKRVGRCGQKVGNFVDYCRMALGKLGLDADVVLSDSQIREYETRFAGYKPKLDRYFLFRCSLAPAIEALIVLDRLLFLLEQDCIQDAHICVLFDPVVSPRCFALIGSKKEG